MRNVNALVAVAGHATYIDGLDRVPSDPSAERHWLLQSFQQGEVPFYVNHMRRGSDLVATTVGSIGLMSGGRTRLAGGHWSEASSYLGTADHYGFWQGSDEASSDVRKRFDAEIFARDSLENVLFSVMNFRRRVGHMPLSVVMVGWEAKQPRFEYHAQTLGVPNEVFTYEGVPLDAYGCDAAPPDMDKFNSGEGKALEQWRMDPLGSTGSLLAKRLERNPFQLTPPYTWAEFVGYAQESGWQPCDRVLAAAALEGATAV